MWPSQANWKRLFAACSRRLFLTLMASVCAVGLAAAPPSYDPKRVQKFFDQGVEAESKGRLNDAFVSYSEVITADPTIAKALKRRGKVQQLNRNLAGAAEDLSAATLLAPFDGEAWQWLGEVRLALKDFSGAATAYQQALKQSNETAVVYRGLADAWIGVGEKQKAIDALGGCLRMRLDNPEPYLARGKVYASEEKYRDAVEDYDRALAQKPDYADVYYYRGHALGQLAQFPRAISDFTTALKLRSDTDWPLRADTLAYRGAAYDSIGKDSEALADYSASLEARPDNVKVLLARSDLHARQGKHPEALRDRERSVQLEPSNAQALLARGGTYHMLGEHEKGFADRTRAIQLEPKNVQSWFARGSAYYLLNQPERAMADLEQARSLDPKSQEILDLLEKVRQTAEQRTAASEQAHPVASVRPAPPPARTQPAKPSPDEVTQAKPIEIVQPAPPVAAKPEPKQEAERALAPPRASAPKIDEAARVNPPEATPKNPMEQPKEAPGLSAAYYNHAGRALMDAGKFEEAIVELTKAVELKPDFAQAWNARGYAYLKVRRWQQALADFDEALRLKPDYENARTNRGVAASKLKN